MGKIVDLQLEDLRQRLAGQRIVLNVTEAARQALAKAAYDPVYGARPLKRYLQQHVETPAARLLVSGQVADGGTVQVTVKEGQILVV
jgi:ATP-dependent Clp protease ATP-binding subunit ClpB